MSPHGLFASLLAAYGALLGLIWLIVHSFRIAKWLVDAT